MQDAFSSFNSLCVCHFVHLKYFSIFLFLEKCSKRTRHVVTETKLGSIEADDSPLKELVEQYNNFQNNWLLKMTAIQQE